MNEVFPGVLRDEAGLLTKNLVPGTRVYGEKLLDIDGSEYRTWNPYRSKLASAVMSGLASFPFGRDTRVLYLGSATGTTVSHISDLAVDGVVACVEFAPRSMRDFLAVSRARRNVVPILGDAKAPLDYAPFVGTVDVVYQDVAQSEQADILVRNLPFLRKGGHIMLCIKARSIDVTKDPEEVFRRERAVLAPFIDITEVIDIGAYEKDHSFVVGVKR